MKHIITVPSRLLRAARLFQAGDDIRSYLRGVYLNRKGYIEASNGHMAFRAPCEACKSLSESVILRIQGSTVGKRDEDARIYLNAGLGWMTFGNGDDPDRLDNFGLTVRLNVAAINDERFPDMDKMFTPHRYTQPTSEIGINGDYIAVAGKAAVALGAPRPHMRFRFNGAHNTIWVDTPASKYPHTMLIMPVRL